MDSTIDIIATFAAELRWEQLPAAVQRTARTQLFDTIGCGIGGSTTPTAAIAKKLASSVGAGGAGRILGSGRRDTTLDAAAFANGVMIRELDFNDWYPGGHPSDCLGTLLTVAENSGASGGRTLGAMVVAYEVFIGIARAAPMKQRGWDQGFGVCVATAAALGNLLGLPKDQIGHAIAISGVAHLPLRATKAGELSLWKGAATAHAARCTLLCTQMAAAGMTGPEMLFEGSGGVWDVITGPFELEKFRQDDVFHTLAVSSKYWPLCGGLQAPVAAALELHKRGLGDADIVSVDVETYEAAYKLNGADAAKWDPQTRETADHSIPYAVVKAIADGGFDAEALLPENFTAAHWRRAMQKVSVRVADDLNAMYPDDIGVRITVRTNQGDESPVEVVNPPGHERNPMTAEQFHDKFLTLTVPKLGPARAAAAAAFWSELDPAADLSKGFDLLEIRSPS